MRQPSDLDLVGIYQLCMIISSFSSLMTIIASTMLTDIVNTFAASKSDCIEFDSIGVTNIVFIYSNISILSILISFIIGLTAQVEATYMIIGLSIAGVLFLHFAISLGIVQKWISGRVKKYSKLE